MKKQLIVVALLFSGTANAATIVMTFPTLFKPSEVFNVVDTEMMTYEVVNGRPFFRRPGDEQCLPKLEDGPVPCDDLFIDLWPAPPVETPTTFASLMPPSTSQVVFSQPTAPVTTPPFVDCCFSSTPTPTPPVPPVMPAVPVSWSLVYMLTMIASLWAFVRFKQ